MEIPVVRYFVACRRIEVGSSRRDYSLSRLVHKIVRLPGEPFPCVCDPLALFATLTSGRGVHIFGIELAFFDRGEEATIWRSPQRPIDLGADPLRVHGLPIPLNNVVFDQGGQYTFYLLCDEQSLAQVELEVR